jgi:hypothetical protein
VRAAFVPSICFASPCFVSSLTMCRPSGLDSITTAPQLHGPRLHLDIRAAYGLSQVPRLVYAGILTRPEMNGIFKKFRRRTFPQNRGQVCDMRTSMRHIDTCAICGDPRAEKR